MANICIIKPATQPAVNDKSMVEIHGVQFAANWNNNILGSDSPRGSPSPPVATVISDKNKTSFVRKTCF